MNKRDIEECNDIYKLRNLCIEYYKTLFYISETCVDISKWHIDSNDGIKKIRSYLIDNDHRVCEIFNKRSDKE